MLGLRHIAQARVKTLLIVPRPDPPVENFFRLTLRRLVSIVQPLYFQRVEEALYHCIVVAVAALLMRHIIPQRTTSSLNSWLYRLREERISTPPGYTNVAFSKCRKRQASPADMYLAIAIDGHQR